MNAICTWAGFIVNVSFRRTIMKTEDWVCGKPVEWCSVVVLQIFLVYLSYSSDEMCKYIFQSSHLKLDSLWLLSTLEYYIKYVIKRTPALDIKDYCCSPGFNFLHVQFIICWYYYYYSPSTAVKSTGNGWCHVLRPWGPGETCAFELQVWIYINRWF